MRSQGFEADNSESSRKRKPKKLSVNMFGLSFLIIFFYSGVTPTLWILSRWLTKPLQSFRFETETEGETSPVDKQD